MAQMPEAIILRKTEETKTGVTYCMADVKTNADRIRSMSDEELAVFLCKIIDNCAICVGRDTCTYGRNGIIDWLKQEAEDG